MRLLDILSQVSSSNQVVMVNGKAYDLGGLASYAKRMLELYELEVLQLKQENEQLGASIDSEKDSHGEIKILKQQVRLLREKLAKLIDKVSDEKRGQLETLLRKTDET